MAKRTIKDINNDIIEYDDELSIDIYSEVAEDENSEIEEVEDETIIYKKKPKKFIKNKREYIKTATTGIFKRTDGTGYAFRAKSNKPPKYDVFVEFDPLTKKPFKTINDAKFARMDAIKERQKKTTEQKTRTLAEIWDEFQNTSHGRSPETIRRYNSIYEIHIKNVFGNTDITKIKAEEINQFLTEMYWWGDTQKNTSDKTRRNVKKGGYTLSYVESFIKFFYLIMYYSWKMEYITSEQRKRFEEIIQAPKSKKKSDNKKIRVLTSEQIQKIDELLKDTDYHLPFIISLFCGTRPAETFALTFDDFDMKKNILNIDKQIVDESGMLVLKAPKTQASNRHIKFTDTVKMEVLERQSALLKEQRKNPQLFEQNRGKVYNILNMEAENIEMPDFINRDKKGRYITAHSFSYYSKIIRKDICPDNDEYEDFSFYTFRKTHLSNMASNNCPVGELMKRAGHSKMETLYNYYYNTTEESESKLTQALEAMDDLI